ncbi:helix-turn-helix domain-containing protein [Streptomyces sp. NBC_01537]|uniref:helix-turn-helix domain-containing protein n=1 Tax=Streptomyces sp. NBC_01537 TaxID=2903896 RepID=UPI00386E46DC
MSTAGFHPPFAAPEGDPEEARRALSWEIFSAFTEVISGEGEWSEQTAARIRAEGEAWASRGESIDDLLAEVRTMTQRLLDRILGGRNSPDALSREVMALRLGDAGRRVANELSAGFLRDRSATAPPPPGHRIPAGPAARQSAAAYAVMAVKAPGCGATDVDGIFRRHAGPDVVVLRCTDGVYVLVPAEGQQEAADLARRAHPDLEGDAWIAVHWQPLSETRDDQTVADDICATILAVALASPPGVYELDDVLPQYAAARTPTVLRRLLQIIEPLLEQPVLWETLVALIAADGSRTRACDGLGIHPDTLDLRLRQITRHTGQPTDTLGGLNTLGAALTVQALSGGTQPSAGPR